MMIPGSTDKTTVASSSSKRLKAEPKKQRDYIKEFVDTATRIGVRVQRTAGFRPYFSIVIGRFVDHEDGEGFVPYIPVKGEIELAKVKSVQEHATLIAALVKDATQFILEQLQQREDEIIQSQQEREQRAIDRELAPLSKSGYRTSVTRITRSYR